MNDWKNVWENKNVCGLDLNRDEFSVFCDLKKADGFDVNVKNEQIYFRGFYDEWISMYKTVMELSNDELNSVYEVGCGSGVNLFMFLKRMNGHVELGGIDYSIGLINNARNIISSNDLVCGEAREIDEQVKYDLVMADSVFQYFENLTYAEIVLRKMISKANKIVYIGEVHDEDLKDEWLEKRRASMENYDEVYRGLPKLFINKKWIEKIAANYDRQVMYTISQNKEYWNSQYIFNCYIY